MMSAGSRSATAFFNMYLAWRPRILSSSGTCAANSTKGMIEERHAALNRCRHAHLILLHEQLHQIGLLIGEQHSRQRTRRRLLLPAIEIGLIRRFRRIGVPQQAPLLRGGKCAVEIIQKKRLKAILAPERGVLDLATSFAGEQARRS